MEKQQDLISVIVPVYNIKEYLERCVDSILAQTWKNLEILLVDDGSDDGTEKLVDELGEKDDRIRVFHKENGGSSSARNLGISEAKGTYLGFVDSDDYIEPFMYERLYRAIQETGMPVAQGGRREIDEQGNALPDICVPPKKQTVYSGKEFMRELLLHRGDCSFCTKLTDASLFRGRSAGRREFPEGKLNEDFHVLVQMLPEIDGIASVPERVYNVFYKSGSNTRTGSEAKFSRVYGDNVDNADMVGEIVRKYYPELMKTALRFGLYQRLDYMLHIPIGEMKKENGQYCDIVRYLKKSRREICGNAELTKKQKVYLLLFSVMPVVIRKLHRAVKGVKWNDLMIWMVLPLLVIFFSYFFLLGKNCVFEINDQLDETLFTYVLNAKYLFSGVKSYPEMLGGVPKGGMSVSACLFIPLYRLFPVFEAFMIQYAIVVATAYIGMYLCVKELTGSGIIGFLCGGMFMFLPYQPVYGLSIVGGPLIFYAFLCLYRQKHVIIDGLLILYFTLGANLVLLGYVALGFVLLADIWILIRGKRKDRHLPDEARCWTEREGQNKWFLLGSLELLLAYIIVNFPLFSELLLGSGGYVSHREEMVITGNSDFWGCVKDVFLNSAQHAFSFHQKLILPILAVVVFYTFRWRRWRRQTVWPQRNPEENVGGREKPGYVHAEYNEGIPADVNKEAAGKEWTDFGEKDIEKARQCQTMYVWLILIILINVLTALFYGFCQSQIVVDFRNNVSGFFHYFSPQRVYWIYPTTWYVAAGLAAGLIWRDHGFLRGKRQSKEAEEVSASLFRQTSGMVHNIRNTSGTGYNIWKSSGTGKKIAGDIFVWLLICAVLAPTAWQIRQNSIWILNKSQYKNNCGVGLMSWADYFAEDLMQEIETAIFEKTGQTQEEYRTASLGMCPAVALEAGFYCIDGYSNNYSLEYKHEFRKIIEAELEKCPPMKGYFDSWGSRCYLFTEESQNYYYLAKDADFRYEKLRLDTEKMKELGCKYLFSAAEIEEGNADRLELELFGVFDTKESYYRVWVYEM